MITITIGGERQDDGPRVKKWYQILIKLGVRGGGVDDMGQVL